jgi:hypothetical protein
MAAGDWFKISLTVPLHGRRVSGLSVMAVKGLPLARGAVKSPIKIAFWKIPLAG